MQPATKQPSTVVRLECCWLLRTSRFAPPHLGTVQPGSGQAAIARLWARGAESAGLIRGVCCQEPIPPKDDVQVGALSCSCPARCAGARPRSAFRSPGRRPCGECSACWRITVPFFLSPSGVAQASPAGGAARLFTSPGGGRAHCFFLARYSALLTAPLLFQGSPASR